jgi:signal transduction histidine kinase/ligand-binding sensor domain-containing protein/DNA-binding response OmpR family regulator
MDKYLKISLLILSILIHALSPLYCLSQLYRFDHLNTKDGLSSNYILCVIQDSRGFVWIGTDLGLNRYDGYEIKEFNQIQKKGDQIGRTGVLCMYEDNSGKIWIGTSNNGMFEYDPYNDDYKHFTYEQFSTQDSIHSRITSVYQGKNGALWFGTEGEGIKRYDPLSKQIFTYKPFPEQPDHNSNVVLSFAEDDQGVLWVGTAEGILHFDAVNNVFFPFDPLLDIPVQYQQVLCLYSDKEGDIWIGTLKGLFKYVREERRVVHVTSITREGDDDLSDDVIVKIKESPTDEEDILWIATRNGLVKYDKHNDSFSRIIIDPFSNMDISSNFLEDISITKNGILWAATRYSGLNRMNTNENPFKQVRLKSKSTGIFHSASALYMDHDKNLWVGACTGGLFKFNPSMDLIGHYQYSTNKGFFIDARSPYTNFIDCISEDSMGNIWIGAGGWGPVVFNPDSESFSFLEMDSPEGFPRPDRIADILEDSYGVIWFGTEGLYKKEFLENIKDPIHLVDHDVLKKAIIVDIYEDRDRNVYFCTDGDGLFCLKDEDRDNLLFTQYGGTESGSPGLYNIWIGKIYEDMHGDTWVVSRKGLNRYNPESQQFDLIKDSTDYFSIGLRQVFGDSNGNLWLSHFTKGLIRYQPEKQSIRIFDAEDGIPFDNIVSLYWYQSGDGRIFIGGIYGDGNGFFYFHPDRISDNKIPPQIAITGFNVKNVSFATEKNISSTKEISLKHHQNYFSFEFAALDYTNPGKNQYAYYLEGLEEDWIYCGNRRLANYTAVPPGDYIFKVKGSNNDGYWNETGAALYLTILPPPWKTWWAYMSYAVIVIVILYFIVRYYIRRQQLLHSLELKQVQTEKLEELDRMKSRFFANISHEFRTPLTLILGPLQGLLSKTPDKEMKSELTLMQRNALRLQTLINQLLSLSRLKSGKMKLQTREENIVTLIRQYIQSFESYAKQKKIDLIFEADEEEIMLYVDKEKIEKILYNLLSNAFKFTPGGGSVSIQVGQLDNWTVGQNGRIEKEKLSNWPTGQLPNLPANCTVISITDTGSGIAPDHLAHIFDRFYQADDSYSRDQEGSGIGLALAKELVELHHGKILVKSEVGRGTTFRIYLPHGNEHLKEEELEESHQSSVVSLSRRAKRIRDRQSEFSNLENDEMKSSIIHHPSSTIHENAPLLLIADDNSDLRAYVRGTLENEYTVIEARDGQEGFDIAVQDIPDLIISDVMMPKMDGNELCEKIKTDERTCHIPVILLTARASTESRLEGLETGADDFIAKPFDPDELVVRINNLITQRKKLREIFSKKILAPETYMENLQDSLISRTDQQFLQKATGVVEKNLGDFNFGVEEFSRKMNLSRMQLHRKLKAIVDQSAGELIRSIRLDHAAKLLLQDTASVTQVAYEVGFNNLSWFTKCFQEKFGVVPSEYKKNITR